MNEWTVVTAIAVIVGLFISVGTPIIRLNSNIVKLNVTLEALDAKVDKNEAANAEDHKELKAELDDHEQRLRVVERK